MQASKFADAAKGFILKQDAEICRKVGMSQVSDKAWAAIAACLPWGLPSKPRVDDGRVIPGILDVLKVGCRWRDCPTS